MDRLAARRALRQRIEPFPCLLVMRDGFIKVCAVGFALEQGQQRLDREADIANQAKIDLAAPAEIFRPDVDLRDLAVRRKELLVGKIGAEHQEHVAGMHGCISRREANEAGHADVVGIVVFDMLLAAERMHHRAFEGLAQLHQRAMCACASTATEHGDLLGLVEHRGKRLELFRIGHDLGRRQRKPARGRQRALRRRAECHVAGNRHDGDATQTDRGADGVLEHIRHLARIGDELAIMRAFLKQILRMGFLEVAAADLG